MPLSRRRFIRQTFAFSAAVALLGDRRFALAADAVAAAPIDGPAQHFLAVGDYGVVKGDLVRQQAVASAMIKYAAQTSLTPEALFMLGDNIYGGLAGRGVKSDRWQWNLENMYPVANFPGPMYVMLGNHDYNDEPNKASVNAQLAYRAANPTARWTLPAKWYRLELPGKTPAAKSRATILVLDTNFNYRDEKIMGDAERQQQLDWLAAELEKPRTAPWLFVFGHHPIYSTGKHGDTEDLVAALEPLLARAKVDLYLSGHDHDLQHLEIEGQPTSFVVSGGGGARARTAPPDSRGPFFQAVYGFSHLELRATSFTLRHIDANGKQLHAFTRTLDGKVTNFA
jgi:tartrate-resistant acid phosphatase type 5